MDYFKNNKNCINKSICKIIDLKPGILTENLKSKIDFRVYGSKFKKEIYKDGIYYEFHEYHDKQKFMLIYHIFMSKVGNCLAVKQQLIRFN